MKLQKKHIIVAAIGLVTITGAIAYWQIKKLMEYCLKVKKIKLNSFTPKNADIDLTMSFLNKSTVKLNIYSQEYKIYINDIFMLKASNAIPQLVLPKAYSLLAVKLQFNPSQLKVNALDLLANLGNTEVKIASKIRVGVSIFRFNVDYDYITTVKEMMSSTEPNTTNNKC